MQNSLLPQDSLPKPYKDDLLLYAPQPIRVLGQEDKNIMPQFYPCEFRQPSSHTPLNATKDVTHTPANASLLSKEGSLKPKRTLKASSAEFVPSWQNNSCALKSTPPTLLASAAPATRPTLPVQQRKAPAKQTRACLQQRHSHSAHAKFVSSVYSPPFGFRHTPKTYFEHCIHYLEMHPEEAEEEMVRYFSLQQQRSAQYRWYQVQAQPAAAVQHENSKPAQCKEAEDNSKTLFEMFEEMEKLLACDTESDDEIEELTTKEAPVDNGCKDATFSKNPSQKSKSFMNQGLARVPNPDLRDNFKECRVQGTAMANRRTPLDHQMQSKAKTPRAISENGQRQRTSGSTSSWRRSVSESPKYRPPQASLGSAKFRSSSTTPSSQIYTPPQASPNSTQFGSRSSTPASSRGRSHEQSSPANTKFGSRSSAPASSRGRSREQSSPGNTKFGSRSSAPASSRRRSPQSSPASAKFGSRSSTPASSRGRSREQSSPASAKFGSRSSAPASSRRRSPQSSPASAKFESSSKQPAGSKSSQRAKTPAAQLRRSSPSRSPSTGKNKSFQKMAKGPNSIRGFALQRTITE